MRCGLIGEKLGHSFSKDIHERIADYTFDLIPLSKGGFKIFMEKKEFTALNVAVPYKKDVILYLDGMDEHAKAVGAVDTIVNRDGKLKGYNTDFTGSLYMVKEHNVHMEGKKVLIIENGGASTTIQAVIQHESAGSMIIVNVVPRGGAINYDGTFSGRPDAEIIINTSPVGMYLRIGNTPIDISIFHKYEAVLDMIYNPILTRLCLEAQEMNIKRVNDLKMLIAQAKQSVEFFLDKSIDDQIIDDIYQDMLRECCNIVLIGMPSTGKTAIGKMPENRMQGEFIDLDDIIIKKAEKSIPEIFGKSGEAGFRAIGTEAAIEVSKLNNRIIATGDGTIKHEVNMDYLRQNGITIFTDRDVDKLIGSDPNRPLSRSADVLEKTYAECLPLYQRYAAYITVNNSDIESTVAEIEEAYHSILIDAANDQKKRGRNNDYHIKEGYSQGRG